MDKAGSDNASAALRKIEDLIDKEELIIFSKEEAAALKDVAIFWRQIKAVVVLGGALGRGLKWLVMIVAIWAAFKGGVLEWIKSGVK